MSTEVKLPRLGQGMESGTIVKWLKSEGDKVEKGEPLYELDTDKVTQEVEAEASGVLLKIAISSGEVEVGRTIAVIGEQGEQVDLPPEEPAGNGAAAQEVADDAQEEGARARVNRRPRSGLSATADEGRGLRGTGTFPRRKAMVASRRRRWRAASHASVASTSAQSPEPVPTAASSPRTSSAPPPREHPRRSSRRPFPSRAWRSSSCPRCARRSRVG
jgi:pyruvate dehydrogenase E2 component (dihydrolipoamide acetyltransferase)